MDKIVNWAILGSGHIAHAFAGSFPRRDNMKLLAIGGRRAGAAQKFAKVHNISRTYGSVPEMLADSDIDVVYIATPTGAHYENIKDCLNAGKHVLCEKTITVNLEQFEECRALAKRKHLILAEALTSVYLPMMAFLKKKIDSGGYGKLHFITVTCGSLKEYDPTNRFFNKDSGGGALFDTGCYAFGVTNYFMHGELTTIESKGTLAPTGVDLKSATILHNENDEYATVMLGFRSKTEKLAIIACEDAQIEIDGFVRPFSATVKFPHERGEQGRVEIYEFPKTGGFELEAEAITADILADNTDCTLWPADLVAKNLQIMDACRQQWGFLYDFEKDAG